MLEIRVGSRVSRHFMPADLVLQAPGGVCDRRKTTIAFFPRQWTRGKHNSLDEMESKEMHGMVCVVAWPSKGGRNGEQVWMNRVARVA